RERLRRADRTRGGQRADGEGARRGRVLAWAVADDRVLDLYRPRDRHVDLDDASVRGRQERLLAALAVRPAPGRRGAAPDAARQQGTDAPAEGVPDEGGAVRYVSPLLAGAVRGAPATRDDGCRGAPAPVRATRRDRAPRTEPR